jgi:hypothetical protein
MKYYDFNKDSLQVPQHITCYGLYSGQIFIIAALLACYLKHYYLSVMLLCLYVTTMLYWSKVEVEYISYSKAIDIFTATLTLLIAGYYVNNHFKPEYKFVCAVVIIIAILIWFMNAAIYYYTVTQYGDFGKLINIAERDVINKTTVFLHILFLHIMPVCTYIYCGLLSI